MRLSHVLASAALAVAAVFGSVAVGPSSPAFAAHSAGCGTQQSDFTGFFGLEDLYDVHVLFQPDGTARMLYFGEPVATGTYRTAFRFITWTFGANTVVSTKVVCADPASGTVTRIEGFDSAGTFIRALVRP